MLIMIISLSSFNWKQLVFRAILFLYFGFELLYERVISVSEQSFWKAFLIRFSCPHSTYYVMRSLFHILYNSVKVLWTDEARNKFEMRAL